MTYGNEGCGRETHKSRIELQTHIISYVLLVVVALLGCLYTTVSG